METFMQKAGSEPLSCCGVGSLQMALSFLSASADENQIGLRPIVRRKPTPCEQGSSKMNNSVASLSF